jgi:uncharacterized membrane-anchored protein YjiN (DUF445 family)
VDSHSHMCCDCPNLELYGIRQKALKSLREFAQKLATKQNPEIMSSLLIREVIAVAEQPGTADLWTGLLNQETQTRVLQSTAKTLTAQLVKKLRSRLVHSLQILADAVLERWQKRRELTRINRKTHNQQFQQRRKAEIQKRREDTAKKKPKKKAQKYTPRDRSWTEHIPKPTPEELLKPRIQTKLTSYWTQSTESTSATQSPPSLTSPSHGANRRVMEDTASPSLPCPRKGVG